MREQRVLRFRNRWKLFWGLRKFLRVHPEAKVIKKGKLSARYDHNRYYATVLF